MINNFSYFDFDHLIGQILHPGRAWCPLILCTSVHSLAPGCSWPSVSSWPGLNRSQVPEPEPETSQPILPPSNNLIVTNITPVPAKWICQKNYLNHEKVSCFLLVAPVRGFITSIIQAA